MGTASRKIICTDIEGKLYEVPISELRFRPSVYGVVIQDSKILLSKQWDGYDFPGGGVELGETIEEALIREVKEETGMNVKPGSILDCVSSFFKLPVSGEYVQSILMYYSCTVLGGELSKEFLDEGELQYAGMPEWVPLSSTETIKFYNSADCVTLIQKARALA